MPKEYINFPAAERVAYALTQEQIDAGVLAMEEAPASPQVGIHWDGPQATVQISMDCDWDVLERWVDEHREHPEYYFGEDADRAINFTTALDRSDMQRLIKVARRARDACFGADE